MNSLTQYKIHIDMALSVLSLHHKLDEPLDLSLFKVWRTKSSDDFDLTSNAAFVYAREFKMKPIELAKEISGVINILIKNEQK